MYKLLFFCFCFKEYSEKKIQENELGLSEISKENNELKNLISNLNTQLDEILAQKVTYSDPLVKKKSKFAILI